MRHVDELEVLRGEVRAGSLRRIEHGASFQYDAAYVAAHAGERRRAIAYAMPVRADAYVVRGVNLHPFFAGLLPEGLRLEALVRGAKTSPDDLFTLLAAAGGDTVGDVWVRPPGAPPVVEPALADARGFGEVVFEELFEHSLAFPDGGDRVTVQGVQRKVSATRRALRLRARHGGAEYLLKLSSPAHPRLVENEAFFMRLAHGLRLPTARVEVVRDRAGATALLVERFDRVARRGEGRVERRHQEDACQLLDRYPAEKYRLSLREVADALAVCSAPVVERLRLVQLHALSYLVGNGDLHGKNVSVQEVGGKIALTPVYDLLSTLPYGDRDMALKLDGRDAQLRRAHFLEFGERVGLPRPAVTRALDRLVTGVAPARDRLDAIGLDERRTQDLHREMGARLGALAG